MRRGPLLVLVVSGALAVLGGLAFAAIEDARCREQMVGDGPNRPGSNCGRQTSGAPDEFRYAIDEGSERRLYLSGGAVTAPTAIRLLSQSGISIDRLTHVLETDRHIDVCRDQPPRDARGWNVVIDDEIADAIRAGQTQSFRIEGLIEGEWRPLRLFDSGCKHHGHG